MFLFYATRESEMKKANILKGIGRFQEISIPIPRTASRISEGGGGSLNWNSEGMGGIYDWKSEGVGGGVSQVRFLE